MAELPSNSLVDDEWEVIYSESNSDIGADTRPPTESPLPSPLPSNISSFSTSRPQYSLGTRIQALIMLGAGVPIYQIEAFTHMSKSQIYRVREKAVSRR